MLIAKQRNTWKDLRTPKDPYAVLSLGKDGSIKVLQATRAARFEAQGFGEWFVELTAKGGYPCNVMMTLTYLRGFPSVQKAIKERMKTEEQERDDRRR